MWESREIPGLVVACVLMMLVAVFELKMLWKFKKEARNGYDTENQ